MRWLSDFPTTNARILWSLTMATVALMVLIVVGFALNRDVNEAVVYAVLGFLGVSLGLDVTQFNVKRKTTIVSPPEVMAENATSETVATVPVPARSKKKPASAADSRMPSPLDDERADA